MSSGWPHAEDGWGVADQGRTPLGPEVSWPTGYPALGYGNEDYRYAAPRQAARPQAGAQPAGPGQHPYAAFDSDGAGYGDDGYHDPGYQGTGYGQQGYGYDSASPATSGDLYKQPWDYEQPLRYEGEAESHPGAGAGFYQAPTFDPPSYNGSEYSLPGVGGSGYDLTGIIGTSDFEQVGYDEPSYGRLSYDDPRYDDGGARRGNGQGQGRQEQRFDQTRFDMPRFDETRLDNLWLPGADARRDAAPAAYGNGGFADTRGRSGSSFEDTRLDMSALDLNRQTRYDTPVLDETRFDLRAQAGGLLAPPKPRNWAEETSLDFNALDLTDEPVPAAFTRTLDRDRFAEREQGDLPDTDTGGRRAIGRRRGRSKDRRHWMALGAIAVVAAGAIGGVMMKYVFAGPSGPAHQVVAPQTVDGYQRSAELESQLHVSSYAQSVVGKSSGHATDPTGAVYAMGGGSTLGANTQMFMFVGGKLSGADPAASIAEFEQHYPGAKEVSTGSFGGEAACTTSTLDGSSASMCVWFDNDTFGTLVSPSMTTAKLDATMNAARPRLEQTVK